MTRLRAVGVALALAGFLSDPVGASAQDGHWTEEEMDAWISKLSAAAGMAGVLGDDRCADLISMAGAGYGQDDLEVVWDDQIAGGRTEWYITGRIRILLNPDNPVLTSTKIHEGVHASADPHDDAFHDELDDGQTYWDVRTCAENYFPE